MPKRKLEDVGDLQLKLASVKSQRTSSQAFGLSNSRTSDVVEIYKEEVDGVNVYCCPFCDMTPLASDIKFRKHLKKDHPNQKTLLKDARKPTDDIVLPKLIIPDSDSEKTSIFSLINNKENQVLGISLQDAKDSDGSPMIVIAENPLVTPKMTKSPDKRPRGRPLSAKAARIQEMVEELEQAERREDTGQVQHCVLCCNEIHRQDSSSDIVTLLNGNSLQSVTNSLEEIVPGLQSNGRVCSNCEDIAKDIIDTKLSIQKLQKKLSQTVSKLLDLALKGQKLLEQDLEDGGVVDGDNSSQLVIKIVEDRIDPFSVDKNPSCIAKYLGKIRSSEDDLLDDGSKPREADQSSDSTLCLTQHEWALGTGAGLIVENGIVHVPCDLIDGLALNGAGARWILSKALCEDLHEKYICLDSGKSFDNLPALIDHSRNQVEESNNASFGNANDDMDSDSEMLDMEYGGISPSKINDTSFSQFGSDTRLKDWNQTDQYRIELRSYMHKEQFKDCVDEVPTLDKPFQCKECNKTFERAHDLWGHHASFRGPAFKCNYKSCEEVFLRLPDFAVHYSAHGGVDLVIPESSSEKKSLHITCPVCHTVVPGLYKLQRHKMKHDPELKYKCPACPKQFVKANTLRMHISNVHKGNRNQKTCKLCDTVLANDAALTLHLQTEHSNVVRSACNICGEIFTSDQQMADHKNQNHFGWNNVCQKCNFQFPKKSNLVSHIQATVQNNGVCPPVLEEKNVTGIKKIKKDPESCPECDVELDPMSGMTLSQHFSIVHADQEQRFQCSDCEPALPSSVKFLTLAGARKHYRMVHTNRSLICWICKDNHASDSDLHSHLASHHPDVVGEASDEAGGCVPCLHCTSVFSSHMERVEHTRFNHLVQSIDITTTDLDEVTMVGGHVIEFGIGTPRIVALHTIP